MPFFGKRGVISPMPEGCGTTEEGVCRARWSVSDHETFENGGLSSEKLPKKRALSRFSFRLSARRHQQGGCRLAASGLEVGLTTKTRRLEGEGTERQERLAGEAGVPVSGFFVVNSEFRDAH